MTAEEKKENYRYKQKHGICPKCGAEIPVGRKQCEVCRLRNAEYKSKNPVPSDVRKEKNAKEREERLNNGLYPRCGKRPPQEGYKQCEICRMRGRAKIQDKFNQKAMARKRSVY